MYYFYIGRAIGGMKFVRCTEVVCLSESPLLEVSLYLVRATSPWEINRIPYMWYYLATLFTQNHVHAHIHHLCT